MSKKNQLSKEDVNVFHEAVKNVRKLTITKIEPIAPKVIRKKRTPEKEIKEFEYLSDEEKLPLLSGADKMEYKQDGVSNKTLRNLRLGKYNADAVLDLHGKTIAESKIELQQFIYQCQKDKRRYLLIIHGKGNPLAKPIIKNRLNHWLRNISTVLAFCSATVRHGSTGALYVLIKN